ncbi:MAG: 50S ribosomal protein L25 [Deltaproteobacteria bacterium]|nr:50S ribosomal protein L25 [Deltaproteobacteria bacterium]
MAVGPRQEIPVSTREIGKHASRTSRTEGKVPGVVYGPKTKPVNVLAEEKLIKKFHGRKFESTLFTLKTDVSGLDKVVVLLRDIQVHPVTRRPVHVDFYALDMSSNVVVSIGLRFEGKPLGLSDGGVLELIVREVDVECKPSEIPEEIVVDVSGMNVGDALHVSDLKAPAGVKFMSQSTLTLATCVVPKEEAAAPVAAAAEAAPAAAAAGKAAPAAAAAGKAAPAAAAAKK